MRWEYVDTRRRGQSQPYHRVAWCDELDSFRAEGGLSPSGKRHGKWRESLIPEKADRWKWEAVGFKLDLVWMHRTEWYWYGEKVTEGDFVLRSK